MVKQREGYKFVILEPAKSRIENGLCPICKKPKSDWTRRTDWTCCSKKCTEEYQNHWIYYGWGHLRDKVLKRDGWKCIKCDHQPVKKTYPFGHWFGRDEEFKKYYKQFQTCKGFGREKVSGKNTLYAIMVDTSKLIADHIHAIALGGDEWDINNIQTLCETCNKIKTADDAKKIAALRQKEKLQSIGQTFLKS